MLRIEPLRLVRVRDTAMYLVGGQRYKADERGLEHALAAAYDRRARPLCLCSEPPIPVYITRLGETFVLKRMPFSGSQHAVDCSHYESPSEELGLGKVLGTAISEDPDTGVTQLRVGFAMSKGMPRSVDSGAGQDRGSVRSDGTRLSLRGLLHFLWHEADLTRWHAGFEGKRTWAIVRSHLLAAASNKNVRGIPLADVLFVPEVFTVKERDEIASRRARRFTTRLVPLERARLMMVLIGEVKEIVPRRSHFNVVIKHVPDMPFLLNNDLHRRMIRHFENELAMWIGSAETHLIIAATFALSDWGLPMIDELCLVPTSAKWIPEDDSLEKQLIDRLVSERRAFDKSLGFNSKLPSRSGPSGPHGQRTSRQSQMAASYACVSACERDGSGVYADEPQSMSIQSMSSAGPTASDRTRAATMRRPSFTKCSIRRTGV